MLKVFYFMTNGHTGISWKLWELVLTDGLFKITSIYSDVHDILVGPHKLTKRSGMFIAVFLI